MDFREFKQKFQKKEVTEAPNKVPSTPLLSVMVQTYQHRNYIRDCLDSILSQKTDFPFEILIGEDASSDGTREICIEYAKKFPEKIRLFLHSPKNKIQVLGDNTGNFNAFYNSYAAKGKYVAICEGDDFWADPLKLHNQVDFLENNLQFSMCFHQFLRIDSEGKIVNNFLNKQPKHDMDSEDLKKLQHHPQLFTICFRNILTNLPEEIFKVLNVDSFLISMLGQHGQGKFLPSIKPSYLRKHSGGIWTYRENEKKLKSKVLTFQMLHQFYKRSSEESTKTHFERRIKTYNKMLLKYYLRRGFLRKAFHQIFVNFK